MELIKSGIVFFVGFVGVCGVGGVCVANGFGVLSGFIIGCGFCAALVCLTDFKVASLAEPVKGFPLPLLKVAGILYPSPATLFLA